MEAPGDMQIQSGTGCWNETPSEAAVRETRIEVGWAVPRRKKDISKEDEKDLAQVIDVSKKCFTHETVSSMLGNLRMCSADV